MIYKAIKTLTRSGIIDITIVLGGKSVVLLQELLGDGSGFNARFKYVFQPEAGGIAEALYLTKNLIQGNRIAVILGDNIFEDIFKREIDEFKNSDNYECFLFLKQVDNPEIYGVAECNNNDDIKFIEEKPKEPKSNLAVTGFYLYNEKIFDIIEEIIKEIGYSARGELEITDVNNLYVKRGKTKAIFINGFWADVGDFDALLRAGNFFQSKNENNDIF